MNNVRIVMTGHGQGEVWLDGERVEGITEIGFRASANGLNELRLSFNVQEVEIEGPVEIIGDAEVIEVQELQSDHPLLIPAKP